MKLALNIEEAADALSVSRTFMYELIDAGKIRTVNLNEGLTDSTGEKKSRYRRIAVTEIQRYLDENTKGPKG